MSGRLDESDRERLLARIERDNPEHYYVYDLMISDLSNSRINYFDDRHFRHMMRIVKELREGKNKTEEGKEKAKDGEEKAEEIQEKTEEKKRKSLRYLADELGVSYRTIHYLESSLQSIEYKTAENKRVRSTVAITKFWVLLFAVYYQVSPRYLLGKTRNPYEWIQLDKQGKPVLNRNGKYRYVIQPLGVASPQEIMAHECLCAMISTQEGKDLLLCFADFYDMNEQYVKDAVQWLGMMPVLKRIRDPIDKDIEEKGGIIPYFDKKVVAWLPRGLSDKLSDSIELFRRLGCRYSECLFWLWIFSSMDKDRWKWISTNLKTAQFCFRQQIDDMKPYRSKSYLHKSVRKEIQEFIDTADLLNKPRWYFH